MGNEQTAPVPQSVAEAANYFIRMSTKYEECPNMAVHERWTAILTLCPFVRSEHLLYAPIDDMLLHVVEDGSADVAYGASELIMLRYWFFRQLDHWQLGMRHLLEYEIVAGYVWMHKIVARIDYLEALRSKTKSEPEPTLSKSWFH